MRSKVGGDGSGDVGVLDADSGGSSAASGSGSGDGGSDSGSTLFGAGNDGAGNDGDGSGGSGTGTVKRRRGRPRKVSEVVGELPGPTLTDENSPRSRGRKRGPDLGVLVDTTVVGLFGLVAVATGHEHWLKEREDVMPITGPLNAWIDQLPAKTLKRVEKNLAPALFVVGLAVVVGPDMALEIRERAKHKKPVLTVSGPSGLRPPHQSPTERFEGRDSGSHSNARSSGEWSGSIPPPVAIGYDGDV